MKLWKAKESNSVTIMICIRHKPSNKKIESLLKSITFVNKIGSLIHEHKNVDSVWYSL